jgi:hypothetical protein
MFKQCLSICLCISLVLSSVDCSSTRTISIDEYQHDPRSAIERVVLTDGSIVEFDANSGRSGVYKHGEIVGFTRAGELVRIPVAQVLSVYYTEADTGKSVLLGVGILAGVAVVGYVLMTVVITDLFDDLK